MQSRAPNGIATEHDVPALPNTVTELLDGTDPARHIGFTLQLMTADPDGWPRLALLSAGEVIAVNPTRFRIALWPESRTTANLTRSGRATLAFVVDNTAYSVRLSACRGEDLAEPARLAVFDSRIVEVRCDVAPYAVLESGIRFRLVDESAVVDRWRTTTAALIRHSGCEHGGNN
jgi:hypothetical protein